jgi:undecaprenyl-diphosphatase
MIKSRLSLMTRFTVGSPSVAPALSLRSFPIFNSPGVLNLAVGAVVLLVSGFIAAQRHREWDYPAIWAMNSYANRSAVLDYLAQALTARDLLQGAAFISLIWFLWFSTSESEIRARLMNGTIAASCAGIVSRGLQLVLPTHLRPLHSPAVGFVLPRGVEPGMLNHYNSFPSDHGALFFALSLVIYRSRPRLGLMAFVWAVLLAIARIYEGYHFPSDVVGSMGLALIVMTLFNHHWFHRVAYQVVTWGHKSPACFYLLAFLLTYQTATLFADVRELGRGFAFVISHHDVFGGGL